MKKLLLLISLFISIAAQAYEPLIREGRVWSYDAVRVWDAFPNVDVDVTFLGTTEINGVVYHNLVGVHNPNAVISLMREENHKVYRYIADNSYIWGQWQNFMGEEGIARYNEENNCHAGEILLYDFDCVSGKRYETISCGSEGLFTICAPGMITHSDQVMLRDGLHTYYILGYGSSFDGEQIEPFRAFNSSVPIYEGIGPVQGLLDCPGCGPWVTCMYDWVPTIIKVYDTASEKTVYLEGDDAGYMPMIVEGHRWEYDKVLKTSEGTDQTVGSATYSFTSATQKDGKNYFAFTDETTGEVAAYLRQEGPKVYMWIDPEKSRRPVDKDGIEITENLLYDFSISPRVEPEDDWTKIFYYKYPVYTASGEEIISFVNGLEYERIGPYLCDAQLVELSRGDEKAGQAVFVEGVGPQSGRLFEPLASIDGNNEKYVLRQLSSGDKILYTQSRLEALYSGIGNINAEKPEHDTRMYDLTGREIRNPQRGTIYIRDGEKRIAR